MTISWYSWWFCALDISVLFPEIFYSICAFYWYLLERQANRKHFVRHCSLISIHRLLLFCSACICDFLEKCLSCSEPVLYTMILSCCSVTITADRSKLHRSFANIRAGAEHHPLDQKDINFSFARLLPCTYLYSCMEDIKNGWNPKKWDAMCHLL